MEYIIRFAQINETFRQAEIEALATLAGVDCEFVLYDKYVSINTLISKFIYNLSCFENIILRGIPWGK